MATTAEKLKAAELENEQLTIKLSGLGVELEAKENKILELEAVIENMPNASVNPEFAELSVSIIHRDSLRLAFASGGQLRKEHAHSDAQQIDRAIDEVLKVWGSNS